MKILFYLSIGSFLPGTLNFIVSHPQLVDTALGILTGLLLGLLVAMLFVGPTPTPAPKAVTPKVNKTVRKPRRIIEQPAPKEWTFTPVNYEWSVA